MKPVQLIKNEYPLVYQLFKSYYQDYSSQDRQNLYQIYDENIDFSDPIHHVKGIEPMINYFANSSKNIIHCSFNFLHEYVTQTEAFVSWSMLLQHKKLKAGHPIIVKGMSYIQFNEKVFYHEDVYDMGWMVYENVPVLKRAIAAIKKRIIKA